MTIGEVRNIFGTFLQGWAIDNRSIPSIELLISPTGEKIVVVFMGTTVTGTGRAKPQVRLFTDRMLPAYRYAIENHLKFFCFILCTTDVQLLKLPSSVIPNHYLLSIESKFDNTIGGRIDLRSLYDNLKDHLTDDFFRVQKSEHNCSITQGAFLCLCDSTGSIDPIKIDNLEKYI